MKKTTRVNFRVVVYPRFSPPVDNVERICEDIKSEIKRHVDYIGSVQVVSDPENVCAFCGSNWTEDSILYNGGCCDRDEENFDKKNT